MVSYFLGANTPQGFYSLYDELIDRSTAQSVYILKGGPGCGKSTLMKKVGGAAETAGHPVEYIRCSGDPDSMDAVILPHQRVAIVDGTAPHVVEPVLPGAVDHYVNLEHCYDTIGLSALKDTLISAMKDYKACYDRAYRHLKAAAAIDSNCRASLWPAFPMAKAEKRVKALIQRELRPSQEDGKITRRFLSAISCEGVLCQWETVEAQCQKVYVLEDSYGFAHPLLQSIMSAASAAGHNLIACPSPMAPEQLEHLLLPGLGLAFVSSTPAHPYPGKGHRHIRLNSMPDAGLLRENRQQLRFSRKISQALVEEGVHCLKEAKTKHDHLEAIYHPHVDFRRVSAIADKFITQLSLA